MSQEEQAVQVPVPDEGASPTPPVQSEAPLQSEVQTGEQLPEGTKQKTADRFAELTDKLKEAQQKIERKGVFEEFQPVQQQVAAPTGVDLQKYVREDGTVDIAGMNQAVNHVLTTGQMGYQEAQNTRMYMQKMDQRIQETEAYSKYDTLNPTNDKFDPELRDLVADRLLRNYIQAQNNPQIKVMTLKEAADAVSKRYSATPAAQVKEAVEEYKQAQEARDQGPMSNGRGEREENVDVNKLREISQKGKTKEQRDAALMARLNKVK